jgi:hypothetical protein
MIGFEMVVMIGEGKGPPRFQCLRHLPESSRQPFGEVVEAAVHGDIAGQFVGIAGGRPTKGRDLSTQQTAQPDITEIHQFGVLDISEVRRISQDRIETFGWKFGLCGTPADQMNLTMVAAPAVADPFTGDGDLRFPAPVLPDLKRMGTVFLGFAEFLDDIPPAAAADTAAVAVDDSEKIGFTLNQSHRKTVYRKDVEGFQGHGVVAAQHVLVAEQVGKIGGQGVSHPAVPERADVAAAQLQSKQLTVIEHLPVMPVSPPVQTVGLIPRRNRFVRDKGSFQPFQPLHGLPIGRQIVVIRFFEKTAFMMRLTDRAVILDGKHAMGRRARFGIRIADNFATVRARAAVSSGRAAGLERFPAEAAVSGVFPIRCFVQFSTGRAHQHIQRMTAVLGHQVAGEQREATMTMRAGPLFNPEKIFDVRLR